MIEHPSKVPHILAGSPMACAIAAQFQEQLAAQKHSTESEGTPYAWYLA